MKRVYLSSNVFIGTCLIFIMSLAYAKIPVSMFDPLTPTTFTIGTTNSALVQYTVTNQSHKTHTLHMIFIPGITSSGCTSVLKYQQSCILSLYITGSALQGDVLGGPKLCQTNSDGTPNLNQCYQPSQKDRLHITLSKARYVVTPSGDGYETINPSTPQIVAYGATRAFVVTVNAGYTLSHSVGGTCPSGSWVGSTYTTGRITSNCSVSFSATINTYTIGGTISGLTVSGLVLQNNGGDNLNVNSGASSFEFLTPIPYGGSYNVSILQQPSGLMCTLVNGSGSGSNVMADVTNIQVSCNPRFAYLATEFSQIVYLCSLNPDGTFIMNTCNPTPSSGAPSWVPATVTIAAVGGVQYAYVGDLGASALSGHIYQCTLNPDGNLGTCNPTPSSGAPLWNPTSTAFATFSGVPYAYVTSVNFGSGGNVYQCTLNPDGTFNTCVPTPSSGAPSWSPDTVTLATINGVQYAYVGDVNGGNLYQCTLNSDGTFNTCSPTPSSGAPSWTPASARFAAFSGVQYAYVGDLLGGNVYQCTLNPDGTLNTCITTPSSGVPPWQPTSAIFATFSGVQYVYVPSFNGNIYRCTLNPDGTFNPCNPIPSSGAPWNSVTWITFN